jgi:hypothetical protein
MPEPAVFDVVGFRLHDQLRLQQHRLALFS